MNRNKQVNLGVWRYLTGLVTFLLIAAGLLSVFLWYLPVIRQNEGMRKQILVLEKQIQEEKIVNDDLKKSVDALTNDPKAIERVAREKLGYARPGETVVRFEFSD